MSHNIRDQCVRWIVVEITAHFKGSVPIHPDTVLFS